MTTQTTAANRLTKPGVIPDCRYVVSAIQEFVRKRRITRTRTVAMDVLNFLVIKGLLNVDRLSEKSIKAALRAVQRFLVRTGNRWGKKKNSKN